MANLKLNFVYSSILTTAGYIFPLLTYPYVTRILGVENIGLCSFIDSIISYFILFSMMGISVIGIREIAQVRNNQLERDSVFSNLILLNTIFTFLSLIGLIIVGLTISKLREESNLLICGAFKLIFNFLLIEWLFKGLEDFRYITVRTLITRSLFVIAIFVFVKDKTDYVTYYLLLCATTVVNAIINVFYSRKFVRFSIQNLSLKKYFKPFIILGINGFLVSMYTTFNVAYLGFVSNDVEVGYYTTSTKLYTIILSLYTAFTGVMLPRMSALINDNKSTEFTTLLSKSISLLISCSIPAIIFVEYFAPQIVNLMAGNGYQGAIMPMRIVMPLVFIIGYEQVLIIQTLMPLKKDSIIFRNSIIGALVGLTLNIILVPFFFAIGSACVWILSELCIMIISQVAVKRNIGIGFPYKEISRCIVIYLPLIVLYIIGHLIVAEGSPIVYLILSGLMTGVYFIVLHRYILKDTIGKYIAKII